MRSEHKQGTGSRRSMVYRRARELLENTGKRTEGLKMRLTGRSGQTMEVA